MHQTHTRLYCFSHLLLANTRASVIYRPNTYAFAYFNISTKHNPHTFHTHSAHIRVCSPKRSKHIRVWFVVEKNISRLLLFSSISNQTHTRLLSFELNPSKTSTKTHPCLAELPECALPFFLCFQHFPFFCVCSALRQHGPQQP